ncbi:hypothetical protein [Streptomyces sp. NPDC047974]|uniref:tetratricopeptide repeat protein n=1 Tax=Streptomyces sp. NPDC047974 TaxID=3154343 RepID=UPI0033F1CBF0
MGEEPNDRRPQGAPPRLDLGKGEPNAGESGDTSSVPSGETVRIRPTRPTPQDARPGGEAPAQGVPGVTPADAVTGGVVPAQGVPAGATPPDAVAGGVTPGNAAAGDTTPRDAVPAQSGPRDATPPDATPAQAAAEGAAPLGATPTGSFRLAAPAPAGGPAPWEAPAQNGGSAGSTGSAGSDGSDGSAGSAASAGSTEFAGSTESAGSAGSAGAFGSAGSTGPGGSGSGAASGGSGGFGPPSGGFGTGPEAGPHGQAPGWAGGSGGQGEARPLQAVAVGLLNLSCLGLGYVLLRQWIGAAVCWAATAALLLLALPADADGVPVGVLVGYGVVLLAAVADGARRGLRARLSLGVTARRLALPLAVVLLAAPAGGTVAYGAAREEAREEAFQQSLLARLAGADAVVKSKDGVRFDLAESSYEEALGTYEALALEHPGSRAAKLVPDRLDAYVASVSAPYTEKKYCLAVDPLKHLRSLPDTVDEAVLGDRAARWDEPLARSLYECGSAERGRAETAPAHAAFTELLALFPKSPHVAEVEKLVGGDLTEAAAPLTAGTASDPCAAVKTVETQRAFATSLKGYALAGAVADADRGVQKGVFACGTRQFRDGDFSDAETTMDRYVKDYPKSPQAAHARSVAIAAQIADEEPEAGKKLPPATAPGGPRMTMVISNDAPDTVELLYTGPVTGKITIRACGDCRKYTSLDTALGGFKPCSGPSSKYPKATISLPAGTYHLLQKRAGSGLSSAGDTKSSKAKIEPGYSYTNCLYVTSLLY